MIISKVDANPNFAPNRKMRQEILTLYGTHNIKLYCLYIPNFEEECFILPMPISDGESNNALSHVFGWMLRSISASEHHTKYGFRDDFLYAFDKNMPVLSRFDGTIPVKWGCDHLETTAWDVFPLHEGYNVIDYIANGYSFPINPNLISAAGYQIIS